MSTFTASTATDKTITLPDGRMVGYADCGDAKGKPAFFFHGWPGSRLGAKLIEEEALHAGIRIIGLDRPGIGLSDFQTGRQILDWPRDVVALADAIGIDRFAVIGVSGGGPYAAACAYAIPDRLTACGIIAGMGPISLGTKGMKTSNRLALFFCRYLPWLLGPVYWLSLGRRSQDEERAKQIIPILMKGLPEQDEQVLRQPEVQSIFLEDLREAFRQGVRGVAYEGRLYGKPWGFKLEGITFDRVRLWQGELDENVPVSMGRAIAKAIPHCQATFYPHEAHLSVTFNHMQEILAALFSG